MRLDENKTPRSPRSPRQLAPQSRTSSFLPHLLLFFALFHGHLVTVTALANSKIKTRSFVFSSTPRLGGDGDPDGHAHKPKLVLIGGCPGTGKSTFGMSVALDQGILKCISTDTVRAVMRSFIPADISPALHRSSYAPASHFSVFSSSNGTHTGTDNHDQDDPVRSWRETCTVLEASVQELVTDSISRGQGLVLEGVSIAPSQKLVDIWNAAGGVAIGCLLVVSNEETHKSLLAKRGHLTTAAGTGTGTDTGTDTDMTNTTTATTISNHHPHNVQSAKDLQKIRSFDRIRTIQTEMIRLAQDSNWILIEQRVEPDPLEIIAAKLSGLTSATLSRGIDLDDDCGIPDIDALLRARDDDKHKHTSEQHAEEA